MTDWLERLPNDWDLIVGIPRSGMLPASLMALYLNVQFVDLTGYLEGRILNSGRRGREQKSNGARKVLVIDDSVNTGGQISQARARLAESGITDDISFAAVFVTPGAEQHVDYWCEQIESPRLFEWNIMHHSLLLSSCLDIDGVLCRDPNELENDDGDAYTAFLDQAEPKFLPSVPIGWLVTSRLEKYRPQTEAWMARYGINYRELIMMQAKSKDERIASGGHGEHKAKAYVQTGADLFIESSVIQAVEIVALSGKPVYCTETLEMVYPQTGTGPTLDQELLDEGQAATQVTTDPDDPDDWSDKLQLAVSEILHVVPSGDKFILIDGDQLGMHRVFAGRRPVPFLEEDGQYAGPPADCETAIAAFEKIKEETSPTRLVLAWPAFWWREHYPAFTKHVLHRHPAVLENSRILVLDLTRSIA